MDLLSWGDGRIEPYDEQATGQLKLEILAYGVRRTRWCDRQRWRLEDRLAPTVRELETLAEEAEAPRLAQEQRDHERRVRWEHAMARGREPTLRAYRVDVLRQWLAAWEEADRIVAYCKAVERVHGARAREDPSAAAWLAFARETADRAQRLPTMPEDPDLGPDELRPRRPSASPRRMTRRPCGSWASTIRVVGHSYDPGPDVADSHPATTWAQTGSG